MRFGLFTLLFIAMLNTACETHYIGGDYRIFNGSPIEKLAKAVKRQDTARISYLVKIKGLPIDYIDPEYGNTLLIVAIYNNWELSVEKLLELGANPNHITSYHGEVKGLGFTPVTMAAWYSWVSPKILKLLLEYGGNPNSTMHGFDYNGPYRYPKRNTALYNASIYSLEKVKILLEHGADINMKDPIDGFTAISAAVTSPSSMHILYYLLSHGASPEGRVYDLYNDSADIIYALRKNVIPLSDVQYKYKLKVIKLLEKKGYDYWNSPIPDYTRKKIRKQYPDSKDFDYYINKY